MANLLYPLLADALAGGLRSWSVADLAIAVVVIAAIVALVYVAFRQFGVTIPGWVIQVFWILAVAFVVIFAIRLLMSM